MTETTRKQLSRARADYENAQAMRDTIRTRLFAATRTEDKMRILDEEVVADRNTGIAFHRWQELITVYGTSA